MGYKSHRAEHYRHHSGKFKTLYPLLIILLATFFPALLTSGVCVELHCLAGSEVTETRFPHSWLLYSTEDLMTRICLCALTTRAQQHTNCHQKQLFSCHIIYRKSKRVQPSTSTSCTGSNLFSEAAKMCVDTNTFTYLRFYPRTLLFDDEIPDLWAKKSDLQIFPFLEFSTAYKSEETLQYSLRNQNEGFWSCSSRLPPPKAMEMTAFLYLQNTS